MTPSSGFVLGSRSNAAGEIIQHSENGGHGHAAQPRPLIGCKPSTSGVRLLPTGATPSPECGTRSSDFPRLGKNVAAAADFRLLRCGGEAEKFPLRPHGQSSTPTSTPWSSVSSAWPG